MAIISIILGSAVLFVANQSNGALDKLAQRTQIMAKETLRDAKLKGAPIFYLHHIKRNLGSAREHAIGGTKILRPAYKPHSPFLQGVRVSLLTNPDDDWFTLGKK